MARIISRQAIMLRRALCWRFYLYRILEMNRLWLSGMLALAPVIASANDALMTFEQAPAIICQDHANKEACFTAIQGLMGAVNGYAKLNQQCQQQQKELPEANTQQCRDVKEAMAYLDTLKSN